MSELSVGQLKGLLANNNVITVPSGHTIYAPGSVVQIQTASAGPARQTISSQTPVAITGLSINFTPRFATSKIVLQAHIHTSATYVSSFGFYKDGSATVSTVGFNNANEPNMQVTTYQSGNGGGEDSVLVIALLHSEIAGTTNPRVYDARALSSWAGGVANVHINNRSSNDMAGISTMAIWEIAQ
jgi:hypothetical protein